MMNEKYNQVILVDKFDNPIGVQDKLKAHQEGKLHRAVSLFVINEKGEWLIQQRAAHKYHSSLLWSNTCCTHPFPDEKIEDAIIRRAYEEMGLKEIFYMEKVFDFRYKVGLDNNLIEHEFDHVFIGFSNETPKINKDEVENYKIVNFIDLYSDVDKHPEKYTEWFKLIFQKVYYIYHKKFIKV